MLPSCSINIFSLKTVLKQSDTIKLFFPFNRKTGLLPFPPQLCAVTPVRAEAGGQPRPAAFAAGSAGSAVGIPGSQANLFIAFPLLKYSPQNSATALGRLVGVPSKTGGVNIFIPYFQMWFLGRGKEPPAALQFTFPEASPSPAAGGASRPWPRMRRRGKAVLPCPSHRSPALSPRPRGQVCACPAPRARPSSHPGTGPR